MKRMTRVTRKLCSANKKLDHRGNNVFNKALVIEVTPEFHRVIKYRAKERNTTMRLWVIRAIKKDLKRELDNE
jgi:predicted HicB family RNase H-like nuclease